MGSAQQDLWMVKSETMTSTIMPNINEPRHAIMCLREIYYVMRYEVVKSDVYISRRF